MERLLPRAEAVLQGDLRLTQELPAGPNLRRLAGTILLFGALFGACMGSYGGMGQGHGLQIVYSALKVPLLLLATFVLSLPSYFVFNTLFGVREDFGQAVRALAASQAGMTIVLASLGPITLLWNVSASDHQDTVLFNALLFGIATGGGQLLLRRYYRPLILRDARHRLLLRLWGILYTFVGIQMGWILRPFVGDPDKPVSFFREDTWGNAYVIVFQMIQHVMRR